VFENVTNTVILPTSHLHEVQTLLS